MRPIPFLAAALAALLPALPLAAQTAMVPASRAEISLSFAPVVQAAAPAVVNIYARRVVEQRVSPFADDPFFDQLFREFGRTVPRVQNALGSGVIVSGDGLVVSNYHVVGRAEEITVVLNDRREYSAQVVLADPSSDLAVLRLKDAEGLPALPWRDSDEVEVGELVLAIGNPFGVGQTVSMGIVSALARSAVAVGDGRGYFLQTDAAINPGNSGGALVDHAGRLVGINTAILTQSGGSAGVGFAIPANLVRAVVAQAEAGQARFQRPWAGVNAQAMDAGLAEGMGLARPDGVVLVELHPASPFGKAGLAPGDVVLTIAGAPVNTPQEMFYRLSSRGVGAEVEVSYLHDRAQHTARVALIPPPDTPDRDPRILGRDSALPGLAIARMNPALGAELELPAIPDGTVVVTAAEGRAAQAGLQAGDVLVAINGAEIATTRDAERALAERSRNWTLDLIREGARLRLRFRL
ncbi:trypsin-like peptidase domain-containing protein [Ruixingdingia sedimenti]|uniref:Trypsin-like peptidase domain-containing protein n=1 Tax=Ruixingdingia sedimenti TaxID=3073604 RepID=A0ABU1FCZ4_9RHOB|nr:trypsin-like peptidase domain-containing protein [Xinfangfangia sp. LG-4]MDR5654765.1 trypsin-like peptidase domain-containing protein [Xinfangfangia sp. LG-4]